MFSDSGVYYSRSVYNSELLIVCVLPCLKVILPQDKYRINILWEDDLFALLVLSSRRSGDSSLGFRAGSL